MRLARTLIFAVLSCCAATAALAQGYPVKPVRLVSPFPPAGGTDAIARIIAQAMGEQMGQQIVVENRGGAGGRIAMEFVAKSAPDGYTLIMANVGPFAITPASGIELRFDPVKDFQPVSLIAIADYILTVHPSLPVRSVKELLALARAKPGELNYASSGNISGPHLSGELLNLLGKVKITHVPYKGNGPAAVALLSGEAAVMFGRGSVLPHIEAGKLRGIATTAAKRSTPGLPTIAETLPGYEILQWYGILVPANTPREIVARLNREMAVALAKPKIAQAYAGLGVEPAPGTPEAFAGLMKTETARYARLIKAAGIKVE
jgi:tripartite-type tricarboxylate transporter receptor subunit TctC